MDSDDEHGEEVVDGKNAYELALTMLLQIYLTTHFHLFGQQLSSICGHFLSVDYVGPHSICAVAPGQGLYFWGNPHDNRAKPAEKTMLDLVGWFRLFLRLNSF